jgi:hypothetical protein
VLAFILALVIAPAAHAGVSAYPSSQTIYPSGPLPPQGASSRVSLNVAVGETEDAQIVVAGARTISAAVDGSPMQPLVTRLLFAHYVRFGSKLIPDALLPWDGGARNAEAANQPLWLQVGVPQGTPPGTYAGKVALTLDGKQTDVPVSVKVWPVSIPPFRQVRGNLQAAFHVSPESYLNKAADLYGYSTEAQRLSSNGSLFHFLAEHRISPLSYGFGEPGPGAASGYQRNARWWLDSATNMERQIESAGGAFPAMRIPISNNHTAARNYLGGKSPYEPGGWCGYLQSVHDFWAQRGWLGGTMPFVYGLDEPGPAGQRLVSRQSVTAHHCFGGARVLMTGNPTRNNRYLWDDRNGNDVDIWTVLSRRFYGTFSTARRAGREHKWLSTINGARAAGKSIWSYTYSGPSGSPGFAATEPLSDSRVFLLWNALEHTTGVLYGQGTTNYHSGVSPLDSVDRNGDFVLFYPGRSEPVTSARLEQIRDGIEDWSIYDIVRKKRGSGRVRAILGSNGIFSASSAKVTLACTAGCDLNGSRKYAWPRWSRDATTAARVEKAKAQALAAASS